MPVPAAAPPPVSCPTCGASRKQRCITSSGKFCSTHRNRVLLAAAPPPPEYLWQGFAYRVRCEVCGAPASVDLAGMVIAHPTRKGDEWCPTSHLPDTGLRKVERP